MKKDIPEIRFEGFKDAWEQCKLGNYIIQYSEVTVENNQYPVFTSSRRGLFFQKDYYDGSQIASEDNTGYNIVPRGYFTYRHMSDDLIFKFNINNLADYGIVSTLYPVFTTTKNMDSKYLQYQLNEGTEFKRFSNLQKQGGSRTYMYLSKLKNLNLTIPSIVEQKKISLFFVQLDDTITLHQRKLDKLIQLKQGYLQQLFPKNDEKVPRVRFTNFNDEWPQCKLGKLGDTFTGLSGKTKEDFGHGEAKFVTYVNVFGNPISDPNGTERVEIDDKQNQVKFGDVFFTTSSETPEEVGMSSIWLENTKNVYLNSFCFGYHPTAELDPYYLAFMLRSPVIRKQFMFLAQGISRYNISKTKVMEMEVPVPNIDEQQKVGLFFKQLDDIITVHQSKIGKLKSLKQSLLQKMFI